MKTPEPENSTTTMIETPGYDALWLWFGLSRASWLTVPRVLCHQMPDEWQGKMAALMNEYETKFPNQPDITATVAIKDEHGQFTDEYNWLNDYRHPYQQGINSMRRKP